MDEATPDTENDTADDRDRRSFAYWTRMLLAVSALLTAATALIQALKS